MSTTTENLFPLRAAPLMAASVQPRPSQLRRSIWVQQEGRGHEPCFATERRFFCEETDCPWRAECLSLRAEWRR